MKKFTAVNEQLTFEDQTDQRIAEAIKEAEKSFWSVISEKFPEIENAPLTTEAQLLFDTTLDNVVSYRVYNNYPQSKGDQ